MDQALYYVGCMIVALLQAMPLLWVARLGRCGGGLVFWLDGRHRRVALHNLTLCFQTVKSPKEIRALAHENFRRIGETYCSAIKTAGMSEIELRKVFEVRGIAPFDPATTKRPEQNCLYATGHFGNFELFARISTFVPGYQCAATYRAFRQPSLDRILRALRTRTGSGCLMFERRTDSDGLKKAMNEGGMLLILVSDQSVKDNGLELPFFGRTCSMSRAPAVMAARYNCSLFVPICYRTALGRWRIEIGEPIPTHENGLRRSIEEITRDINTALEAAVRRDPANWFWVHNRWKTRVKATSQSSAEAQSISAARRGNSVPNPVGTLPLI
jgi:lauroyl/myristoyl acyltransferase